VSCARLADGSVACWGSDRVDSAKYYQRNAPARLKLDNQATQLASSERTGCALIGPRNLTCWGQTYACAFRDYYCFDSDKPAIRYLAVPGDATQLVAADDHSCVLLSSGNIACVGSHEKKQLGRALPSVETTHYAHHAESCNEHVWEEPPGWPDLLPVLW
jgi:alpha-tubulin suppressor-like RCC1 family protein